MTEPISYQQYKENFSQFKFEILDIKKKLLRKYIIIRFQFSNNLSWTPVELSSKRLKELYQTFNTQLPNFIFVKNHK